MGEDPKHSELKDLDQRLSQAKQGKIASEHFTPVTPKYQKDLEDKSMAMRIVVDFVSSVLGGLGIGYVLDTYADTKPWGMIVMMLLGVVAGFWNIFRLVSGNGYSVGLTSDPSNEAKEASDDDHSQQS